jgi:hypothetical protein
VVSALKGAGTSSQIEPSIRESKASDQHGYDKACTLNIAEIVVTASERVLQLCGHGTAVIASARTELERIRAMFGFVKPAALAHRQRLSKQRPLLRKHSGVKA